MCRDVRLQACVGLYRGWGGGLNPKPEPTGLELSVLQASAIRASVEFKWGTVLTGFYRIWAGSSEGR